MPEVLISIVIPTHNRAQLLARSLRSVLEQTWRTIEVIVVDDASSEDVGAVVRAAGDDRVRLLRLEERSGAASARNAGIREARGAYIAFQDSDDLWLPEKLKRQMACMQRSGADMVCCAFHRCDEAGRVWQTFPHADVPGGQVDYETLLFENLASTQTMLAKAELLRAMPFDERYPALEDWALALRVAREARLVYQP